MIKYDTYKDSGIDWLGEIPEHWEVNRLKNVFSFCTGLSITKKNLQDKGIPCVNYGEIHSKYGFEVDPNIHPLKCVDKSYLTTKKKSLLSKGDFIFSDTSEDIEGSGNFTYLNSNTQTFAGYHTIVAKLQRKGNYRFIAYLLDSIDFRTQIQSNVAGIKVYSITQGLLKRLNIFFPPLPEQTQIANYLDRKTKAIDQKIDLLTQKTAKYKELRKAIINQTVTKGLDKTVKLKNSGIEWIDKIPMRWEVKRFKDICYKNHTGGTPSTSKEESFLGNNTWVTIRDIGKSKYINKSRLKLTDNAIEEANIPITPKGSLLYSFKLTLGKIGFATEDIYTNEALITILKTKHNNLDFLYYMLPIFLLMNATENIYGAKMLNQKLILNAILVSPPLKEQTAIATYLDKKTGKIDTIVSNIESQINHLKELRKTLINDVVTGKIKVID